MPSQILHCLAGEYALQAASFHAPDHRHFKVLFNLGCQGPDVFAHSRRTKPLALTYARLLHRGGYGRFCRHFASQIAARPWSPLAFWFAGFITHQVLDRILHPYIVYRAPLQGSALFQESAAMSGVNTFQSVRPAAYHAFLERVLDAAMLFHLKGAAVSSFDTEAALVPRDFASGALESAIAAALRRSYPETAAADELLCTRIHNAFSDTAFFYTVTNPARLSFASAVPPVPVDRFLTAGLNAVALLYPEDVPDLERYLNPEKKAWLDPGSGESHNDSVPELFFRAVEEAGRGIRLVEQLCAGKATVEDIEAFAGNNCLSAQGPDGKIAIPRFRDPFDLDPLLLQQAERRRLWLEKSP